MCVGNFSKFRSFGSAAASLAYSLQFSAAEGFFYMCNVHTASKSLSSLSEEVVIPSTTPGLRISFL